MKSLSAGLLTAYASETTTIATCWKLTLNDQTVLGFTDHTEDLIIGGLTYQAADGFTASTVDSSVGFEVDNLELQGFTLTVAKEDLRAGRYDHAAVEIFEVDYANLAAGVNILRRGFLGQFQLGRTAIKTQISGLLQVLQNGIVRVQMPTCDADLGDARCGVDLGSITDGTIATTVTGVTSQRLFAASGLTQADGWFTYGLVTWTSGNNAGYSREVKSYVQAGAIVTLQDSAPFAIAIGDAFSITAGCAKTREVCSAKFANVINFRGFPDVPGTDRYVTGT